MADPVDVLIIGAGASGGAVAWSLAETKMRILCLEQGDWVKPTDYPTNGRDWEARQLQEFNYSPNRRGRVQDYPVNDAASPIRVANFNGVGGGTIMPARQRRSAISASFNVCSFIAASIVEQGCQALLHAVGDVQRQSLDR